MNGQPPTASHASIPRLLLTEADVRHALGGLSIRTFTYLRAKGVICPPLKLGPRIPRWTIEDVSKVIATLPRANPADEPERLAAGKRLAIARRAASSGAQSDPTPSASAE